MEAIIKTGGHQYRIRPGDIIKIQKLSGKAGDKVHFDNVLMLKDGNKVKFGTPKVEGISVEGTITEQGRNRKIIVFFYRNKTRNRKKSGHRQPYTKVKIDKILKEVNNNGKKKIQN